MFKKSQTSLEKNNINEQQQLSFIFERKLSILSTKLNSKITICSQNFKLLYLSKF